MAHRPSGRPVPVPAKLLFRHHTSMPGGFFILTVPGGNAARFPRTDGWLCAILGLCALLIAAPAPAARWDRLATTVFHSYGREQGLPHPALTALAQDRQGFIWIGTQGGLARWDGYRFRAWRADHGNAGSLPDDYIQTLHIDPAGRLWVGTGGGRPCAV